MNFDVSPYVIKQNTSPFISIENNHVQVEGYVAISNTDTIFWF